MMMMTTTVNNYTQESKHHSDEWPQVLMMTIGKSIDKFVFILPGRVFSDNDVQQSRKKSTLKSVRKI